MKPYLILFMLFHALAITGQSYETSKQLEAIEGQYDVDDNGNVYYLRIIDSLPLDKDEIYDRALAFFTYNYVNGEDVVQIQDKANGQIIGKGLFKKVYLGAYWTNLYEYGTYHILRIDIKDNKARVILTMNNYKVRNTESAEGIEEPITSRYPFVDKCVSKNSYGQSFLESHKRALNLLASLEKSLRTGNTGGQAEKKDW